MYELVMTTVLLQVVNSTLVAYGATIPFRLLNFPDLTAEVPTH